ncbi:MAG: TIGR01777 family protein [Bacteroidetes bacterium]|nr:MAG: TIGR01777 family protein [Bacteroidota bacterium]
MFLSGTSIIVYFYSTQPKTTNRMKHVVIVGGTGFIGRHLVNSLKNDWQVTVLSRNPEKNKALFDSSVHLAKLDAQNQEMLVPLLEQTYAVINLAGENVGSRWTKAKKEAIRNSRLDTDHLIVHAVLMCKQKPAVVIQGSGMGVYGFETTDKAITEKSPLGTKGFLTEVGIAHEEALKPIEDLTRVVYLRTGLVLHGTEGSLPQMAATFKMFLGGPMGSGRQWTSWIHIKDEVRAIRFLMENEKASGPFNLTAPHPVRNSDFSAALGKAMHRPVWLGTPAAFLRLVMKDMADELLLEGLNIIPERLLEEGFRFEFGYIEEAFRDLYSKRS